MNNSVEEHFDKISASYDYYKQKNRYYYDNLKLLIRNLIINSNNASILDCGCGTGDVLNYLKPRKGVGIDTSANIINLAEEKYANNQNLIFMRRNVEQEIADVNFNFDYVLMIDILEHLKDPPSALRNIKMIMQKNTELIIITANKKWSLLLLLWERLELKMPEGEVRWFSLNEIENLLKDNGFEMINSGYRLLIPANIPCLSIINNIFYNNKFFEKFGLIQFVVAKAIF